MSIFLVTGCCILHSHTNLHGSTIFLLKRLQVHAEEGEAAGQVGICIFRVSASVRATDMVFFLGVVALTTAFGTHTNACGTHLEYKVLRSERLSARYSSERPSSHSIDNGSLKPSSTRRPRLYHP